MPSARPRAKRSRRVLALTQGDPVGVGPEILLKLLAQWSPALSWSPVLVAERLALEALRTVVDGVPWERLVYLEPGEPLPADCLAGGMVPVVDPVGRARPLRFAAPTAEDASASLRAIDLAVDLVEAGTADALVTGPVNKRSIAESVRPDFRGHTEYLAARFGDLRYGRDYLMAFLGADLRVALLSTHLPLRAALDAITVDSVLEALLCLGRHSRGRIGLAGLNPHAGEGGLLGAEDQQVLVPAVRAAQQRGVLVLGPESPDTVFLRARRGELDWVLALYHDQGLIAVKTVGFGSATNWTMGLPLLRTSVDHGTGYPIAGRGVADVGPLRRVVDTTLELLADGGPAERSTARAAKPDRSG